VNRVYINPGLTAEAVAALPQRFHRKQSKKRKNEFSPDVIVGGKMLTFFKKGREDDDPDDHPSQKITL
jgi:hypothetical protein